MRLTSAVSRPMWRDQAVSEYPEGVALLRCGQGLKKSDVIVIVGENGSSDLKSLPRLRGLIDQTIFDEARGPEASHGPRLVGHGENATAFKDKLVFGSQDSVPA